MITIGEKNFTKESMQFNLKEKILTIHLHLNIIIPINWLWGKVCVNILNLPLPIGIASVVKDQTLWTRNTTISMGSIFRSNSTS